MGRNHDIATPRAGGPRPLLTLMAEKVSVGQSRVAPDVAEVPIPKRANHPVAGELIIAADLHGPEPTTPAGGGLLASAFPVRGNVLIPHAIATARADIAAGPAVNGDRRRRRRLVSRRPQVGRHRR